MIQITSGIVIDDKEIQMDFIRASGPGGQNVNKVSSAVQLRFDVRSSPSLPADVRARLIRLAGRRVNENGVLIIHAKRFRTQLHNRQDAMDRLIALIKRAAVQPKTRRRTKPPEASKKRTLDEKHIRGQIKRLRKPVDPGE
ncbi:MAG: aminoacyl-tRNA hydrolase [Deltaproteobacteria bacterium]|nr:aminoacyl-tRNA hydrolase [Deltaproteobacteria bacterium]